MKHKLLFLLILFFSTTAFSQLQLELDVLVVDFKTSKKEGGVTMKVYDGSTIVGTTTSTSNGKILLKVPAGKVYKVEISKAGKVTRFFTVNSKNIDIELLQGASEPFVRTSISLFDKTANVDYSYVESNPTTDFYFDGKSTELVYNKSTADKMIKKVEEIIAQADKTDGNNEVQYQAKMKEGESLATAGKYEDALTRFEQASMFKKNDKTAINRMDDMDKLIKANKISQIDGEVAGGVYDNLIQAAKTLKSQKKYQLAIDKYEEALEAKRNDQFALDEIDDLMALIQKEKREKENEGSYAAAMSTAEILMKQKSYQAARDQYDIALKAKPADPTATTKKKEVLLLLEAAQGAIDKKKKFDAAILAGDQLFKSEKWEEAKAKYDEALGYEAASTYAKGQNDLIIKKLADIENAKALKVQIDKLIADGTTAFDFEKWDEAKLKFTEVKKLDDKNAIALEKLAAIQTKLDELKQNADLEAKFKKLVDEGDLANKGLKYEDAIAKYSEALGLKANPEVEQKKTDAETALNKLKNQKELKANFDLAMKDGEALLIANKLEEAKLKFTEASDLDQTAQLPKDKIKLIDEKILANKSAAEKTENYNLAMEAGNTFRTSGKLDEAILEYQKAQGIDKTKTEPATKIKEVEADILTLAASKSAQETEEKFNAAMESGNGLRASGKLNEAILEYQKAQGIDKTKTEPATKIKEVEADILTLAASKSVQETEEKFNAAMEKGNTLRASGKLDEAILEYQKAQGIDNTKTEPADKIIEVQAEIVALNASKSAEEKTKNFNAAMEKGNTLRASGKLNEAILEYQKAQGIDNTKTEPADKIIEVQAEIVALNASKSAQETEEKFNAAMEKGNTLRASGKLNEAILEYQKAQGIDNTKTEPADKIIEVQAEMNALSATKSAKEKSEKFKASMEKAKRLRTAGKLEEAIAEYKVAQGIDELKTEPANKIQEIQDELAAKTLNPDDLAYTELMTSALTLEEAKEYKQAVEKYQAASNLKSSEKKPKEKIIALNGLIEAQELKAITDAKYNEALKKGKDAMAEEDYMAAIKHFNEANKTKQNEVEPVQLAKQAEELSKNKTSEEDALFVKMLLFAKQKMDEKDFVKAEELIERAADNRPTDPRPIELQKELNRQIKNNKDYQVKMTNAKDAFDEKEYDQALKLYQEAKVLLPNEVKPDEGIAAVKREKALLENVVQEDEVFLSAIRDAEAAFAQKKYVLAITEYKKAAARKPDDKNIEPKIDEIQKIINDLANAANMQAKKANFDGIVAQADNLFESSKWSEAKAKYEEANNLIENNTHVLAQIQKCSLNIDNKKNKLDEYNNLIVVADKKFNQKQYQDAKDLYLKALKINNSDSYPHSQLAKIDGVLNPVLADDGSLVALGIPTDNSLLEGQALLERAAKIRAHRSTTELRDKEKELEDLGRERTNLKTEQNQAISVELKNKMEVQELVEMDKDGWRKTVVDSVRHATNEIASLQDKNNVFEISEGQEAKRLVAQKTKENEEKFVIKHQVFAENTEKVKRSSIREEDALIEKSANLYNQQLETKTTFTQIEIGVEENTMDDLKDRELVVDSVRFAQKSLSISDFDQNQRMIEKSMNIKQEVVQSNVIRESKDIESDEKRQEVVEKVKVIQEQATKVEENSYTQLYDKSQNTRQIVTTKHEMMDVENTAYQENQDLKIAELVSTEKKVVAITSKNQDNDDLLRQQSKDLITTHVKGVETIVQEGAKTPEKNQALMKEEIELTSERVQEAEDEQVQKNREARKFVEDIANQKMVYSEKVANEIGKNYPEGVSQESFQKNGNDGLPIAFITRRVVVINGHGEVYVRTQSLSAITYSKNGDPSSEHIWQKETSSAKLIRNF